MSPTGTPPRSESEIGRRTGDAREGADPLRATGRSESTAKVAAAFARNARASVPPSISQILSIHGYGNFGIRGQLVRTLPELWSYGPIRTSFDRCTQSIFTRNPHCADRMGPVDVFLRVSFAGFAAILATVSVKSYARHRERRLLLLAAAFGIFLAQGVWLLVEAQRRILAVLRQDVPRKILVELLTYEGRTFAELQASVGVSKSTLSYHLQKLMQRDLLVRTRRERESVFTVKDVEEVRKLLLANRSSFNDDAVDRFADLWSKMRS